MTRLCSVVALTNSSGNTVEVYEYSVFGQVGATDQNHPNRFLFTGREFDRETGLYYYRARYYNPQIGRFLQTDPIGYGDGMNWYAYCGNSPLVQLDPYGNIAIAFYDPDEKMDDGKTPAFLQAANDFTTNDPNAFPGYFAMRSCEDVINKLKELRKNGIVVTAIYFYDHSRYNPLGAESDLYGLEFGKDTVKMNAKEQFWADLGGQTPSNCVLNFRQCYAGRYAADLAAWTGRTVTGCIADIKYFSNERGKSNSIDVPDYNFNSDVIWAKPVWENVGGKKVRRIDWGYVWRYKESDLGTSKEAY